jgi:hypothetical protein
LDKKAEKFLKNRLTPERSLIKWLSSVGAKESNSLKENMAIHQIA